MAENASGLPTGQPRMAVPKVSRLSVDTFELVSLILQLRNSISGMDTKKKVLNTADLIVDRLAKATASGVK